MPTQGARVFAAFVSGGAWSVSVIPLGHPETTTVTAYVECLSGVNSAVVTRRERMFTMSPYEISDTTSNEEVIACNDGEVLVGFGFDFAASSRHLDLHGIDAVGLGPPEVSHWTLAVRNHDTVPHAITLYGQRLSNVTIAFPLPQSPGNVKPVIVQASYYTFPDPAGGTIGVPVDPGKSGFLQRDCPAGTIVAGGGLYYEGGDSGSLTFLRAAPAGWQGEMLNDGARLPLFLNVVAECLRFS